MTLDEFSRHIIKGSNYAGHSSQLQFRQMAPLHALKLQSTSPVQVCRVCRGARAIGNQHSNHLVDFERCHWCGGMGTYDIRKLEAKN